MGRKLANSLDWPFHDADGFHPQANIDKMKAGIPLTNEDRQPWLHNMAQHIQGWLMQDKSAVLAVIGRKVGSTSTQSHAERRS